MVLTQINHILPIVNILHFSHVWGGVPGVAVAPCHLQRQRRTMERKGCRPNTRWNASHWLSWDHVYDVFLLCCNLQCVFASCFRTRYWLYLYQRIRFLWHTIPLVYNSSMKKKRVRELDDSENSPLYFQRCSREALDILKKFIPLVSSFIQRPHILLSTK